MEGPGTIDILIDSDSEDEIDIHVGVDENLIDKPNKKIRCYLCDKCEQSHDRQERAVQCKCERFCTKLWYPTNYVKYVYCM